MISLNGAMATHVGNVREVNQDRGFIGKNTFAVADGMGGHRGGEVASMLTISKFDSADDLLSPGQLEEIAQDANALVFGRSIEDDLQGMGTTLVAIAIHDDQGVSVINIGDSRAYWLRDGYLAQVTRDHSFVSDLVEQKEITEEEALNHPKRNIITRALGIASEIEVDSFPLNVEVGDRFLLCSDGLTDEVLETEIVETLMESKDIQLAADKLVEAALINGGKDNITVLVVEVLDPTQPSIENKSEDMPVPPVENLEHPPSLLGEDFEEDETDSEAGVDKTDLADVDTAESDTNSESESNSDGESDDMNIEDFQPAGVDREDTVEIPVVDLDQNSNNNEKVKYLGLVFLAALGFLGFMLARSYAQSGWFITDEQGEVILNKGKPGGFLWFEPEKILKVADTDEFTPKAQGELKRSDVFESSNSATEFISSLEKVEVIESKSPALDEIKDELDSENDITVEDPTEEDPTEDEATVVSNETP